MKYFNFKNRHFFSGPHLLGSLLLLAGIVTLIGFLYFITENSTERHLWVGDGAIALGLLILSSYSGTLIEFSDYRFKEYFSLGGYKFGAWTSLPPILTVKVISASSLKTNTPNGISPTLSGRITDYTTLVYSNASNPVLSFVYGDKDLAVKQATYLASNLKVDLIIEVPD